MQRFHVFGANRNTGEECDLVVTAVDERAAMLECVERWEMLVSSVTLVPDETGIKCAARGKNVPTAQIHELPKHEVASIIIFKCLKCNEQLESPSSMAGETIACPRCRNVHRVPSTAESSRTGSRMTKPSMPGVFKAGIGLYVGAFVFAVLGDLAGYGSVHLAEDELAGLVCVASLLLPLQIMGLVMACFGRAWGAILMICTTAAGLLLWIPVVAAIGISPLEFLSTGLGIGSLVCFIVPDAWDYYRNSERFRNESAR